MTASLGEFSFRDALIFLAVTALCVATAATIVVGGVALMALGAVFALVCLLVSARFRLLYLVFGGLAVFQSSGSVSPLKSAFVLGALLVIAIDVYEAAVHRDADREPTLNFVYGTSILLVGVLAAATAVGVLGGVPPMDAVRDIFSYLVLAAVPVLGLDAARAFDVKALRAIFATVGTLAVISFSINWLARRGLGSLGLDHILLSSFMLCAATICYALARVIDGEPKGRTKWFVLACLIPGLIFITGTRAGLSLLLIPLVMFFVVSSLSITQRIIYAIIGVAAGAGLMLVIGLAAISIAGIDQQALQQRLTDLPGFSNSGAASLSLVERANERESARGIWREHPLVGSGAGVQFEWPDPFGRIRTAFTIDSILAFPAKFGIVGIAALLLWMAALVRLILARKARGAAVAADALLVYGIFAIAYGYLASPLEDKGLGFGLILMFGLLFAESEPEPEPESAALQLPTGGS